MRSGYRFTDLVKPRYRFFLTRGMKGGYVYFEDSAARARSTSDLKHRARRADRTGSTP